MGPEQNLEGNGMALHASWAHGNALTVENPENFVSIKHMGWGTDLEFFPGRQSWLHIPVPTPVIVKGVRAKVKTFFLLFNSDSAFLKEVHIFDGQNRVHTVKAGSSWGPHASGLDAQNTFTLPQPHSVLWGMGISFLVNGSTSFDVVVKPKFTVVSAGADFMA